jgi:dUTP pyrophosphatase
MKIKKLHPGAVVPTYAHETDACFDLYAATVAGMTELGRHVDPMHPVVFGTGLAFEVPPGFAMLIFSRSGHAFKHDARLANCVGVIDSGFTGEVMVKLTADDSVAQDSGRQMPLHVKPGDRIAQAMLVAVPRVVFEVVDDLGESQRGAGGFGSSGT